jgi:endonuclease YncB( thermonuclease family)
VRRWACAGLIVLALSAALDRFGAFRYQGDDWRTFDQKACLVTHVADGDTIVVRPTAGGPETRVRLLGIDAPELHSRDTAGRPDYWAAEAKRYTLTRLEHKAVTLRLEQTETRDRYRRLLAYVYVNDSDNLNLDLVRDGHAYADRRFRHSMKYQFERAETEARKAGRGLWKGVTESQMPPWRQDWLARTGAARGR